MIIYIYKVNEITFHKKIQKINSIFYTTDFGYDKMILESKKKFLSHLAVAQQDRATAF